MPLEDMQLWYTLREAAALRGRIPDAALADGVLGAFTYRAYTNPGGGPPGAPPAGDTFGLMAITSVGLHDLPGLEELVEDLSG